MFWSCCLAPAAMAMANLNFSELHGKRIRISPSQRDPSRRRGGQGNIFIKNLPEFVDGGELYVTFQQFGPILSSKVVMDPVTGLSRVTDRACCALPVPLR
jgi:RNA recognition motif-containing protein